MPRTKFCPKPQIFGGEEICVGLKGEERLWEASLLQQSGFIPKVCLDPMDLKASGPCGVRWQLLWSLLQAGRKTALQRPPDVLSKYLSWGLSASASEYLEVTDFL